MPYLLLAAGGTGGHMFPAQALSEAMLRKGWRVALSTDARGARYAGGFSHAVELRQVTSATFARASILGKLAVPFRLAAGIARAWWQMRADRPDVVVGFGGYPAIPAMAAARLLRVRRIIHEQNGVLGRVNRVFARHVDLVACGTWPTDLPQGTQAVFTGNPVRATVAEKAGAPYGPPGDWPMVILVIGGSQGAHIFSHVVPQAMAHLPEAMRARLRIAQQARPEDIDAVQAAYDQAGLRAEIAPFFADVPRRLAEAQLVISRAGASSIADISAIGRPAILVPFARATGDHQSANAKGLADAGGAVVIAESALTAQSLAQAILAILGDPARAEAMAASALQAAPQDATGRLVELVETLATGHPR